MAISALESFSYFANHPLILSLLEWLYVLESGGHQLGSVGSHVGVKGNEQADRLAKMAAPTAFQRPISPHSPGSSG